MTNSKQILDPPLRYTSKNILGKTLHCTHTCIAINVIIKQGCTGLLGYKNKLE